ncbi:thiamine pyrophosphate-dependent dehydrogenase E1 component subunit alpha [Actinomadura macra]|uniref:thiamine pyrophosphate-dependent dehydrogenase E1 component subunit alpha n=1 Tax=Actinomadura macra TaxID=46164 RepID=UPI00082DE5DF|nr:thiamine pyrophosphate-dependent dehydrogenase E1 component subunit alpha [Actinomadura macra]
MSTALMSDSVPVRLYRTMRVIREFEITAQRLLAQNRIKGGLHLSVGQEAVAAGVCDVLRRADHITSTHRGHGHCLAKGGEPGRMMAELFARSAGYCGGRSGSMHIADPRSGILGANAIVGGGIPIAVGSGFAGKARGDDHVAVAFFGEGAVAEGAFHESLNLAALWRLPVIFVCENNEYAELSHISVHLPTRDVADFAAPYGMPGVIVDGNDAVAVREKAAEAVARARAGDGPTLLECKTYRWMGHFEGDQQRYRDKAEVERWRQNDPLERLRQSYVAASGLGDDLAEIDAAVRDEVARAVEWAEAAEPAGPEAVAAHVYHDDGPFRTAPAVPLQDGMVRHDAVAPHDPAR